MTGGIFRRKRNLGFTIEGTEGTWLEPTASEYDFRVLDPTYSIEPLVLERNVFQTSYTTPPPIVPGVSVVTFNFGIELCGDSNNVGATASTDFETALNGWSIAKVMRACGLRPSTGNGGSDELGICYIGSVTDGPFQHGEGLSWTDGGAQTGECFGDIYDGFPRMMVKDASGALSSGITITGDDSGATAVTATTMGTGTRIGLSPVNDPNDSSNGGVTASIELNADGLAIRGKGCRGTWTFTAEHGNAARFDFTFRGVLHEVVDATQKTPQITMEIPPAYIGVGLYAIKNAGTPEDMSNIVHNSLTIDWGQDIIVREDSSSSTGYSCGIVSSRTATMTVNPDLTVLSSNLDWLGHFEDGEPLAMHLSIGSTVGNLFDILIPGVVGTSASDEERDGQDVIGWQGRVTSGQYATGDNAVDNEFFLYYY